MKEKRGFSISGWFIVLILLVGAGFVVGIAENNQDPSLMLVLWGIVFLFSISGFFIINPNKVAVLQFFGSYVGTVTKTGLRWTIPFFSRKRVSVRIRNFETAKLKVNDGNGNPIQVAAIVVWRVVDSAKAVFEVNDYLDYTRNQSEAALREMVMNYPYESFDGETLSLVGDTHEIADQLQQQMQQRLERAGVEVIETLISHLSYSSEIASAMLQRQQADAVVAARQKIVEGAVGMVELALEQLAEKQVVHLDNNQKAKMVNDLLVVLCSNQEATPVVDMGG